MKPYKVLGVYHPKTYPADRWNSHAGWRAWAVGEDLTALTASLGLVPHIDPEHGAQTWPAWYNLKLHAEVKRQTPEHPGGEDWHYDGDTTHGANPDCAIVLWASVCPTDIRLHTSNKIWRPEPFEVIVFNNRHCSHRRPPEAPKNRFLFRQRVQIPVTLELP
jgi:hypothetical protein